MDPSCLEEEDGITIGWRWHFQNEFQVIRGNNIDLTKILVKPTTWLKIGNRPKLQTAHLQHFGQLAQNQNSWIHSGLGTERRDTRLVDRMRVRVGIATFCIFWPTTQNQHGCQLSHQTACRVLTKLVLDNLNNLNFYSTPLILTQINISPQNLLHLDSNDLFASKLQESQLYLIIAGF